MTSWRDHQRAADLALFDRHGDVATYTPPLGEASSLPVLVSNNFEILDENGGVSEYMTVIRYRLSDIASHAIGATIVADGVTYSLGKTIDDDGFIRTVEAIT